MRHFRRILHTGPGEGPNIFPVFVEPSLGFCCHEQLKQVIKMPKKTRKQGSLCDLHVDGCFEH